MIGAGEVGDRPAPSVTTQGVTPPLEAGPVGIGLIGAGMIGQLAHLANFAGLPGCRVVALAELRPQLGRQAADRFAVPRVYANHRELLDDAEVDAVVVVTRRPATGPIVLDALSADKHVLSEKPMAHSVTQATRLVDAAARRDLRYAVGMMKRHDAGVAHAKDTLRRLLARGTLGELRSVRAHCFGGAIGHDADGFLMTDEVRPDGLELWPEGPDWLPREHWRDYAWFLNVNIHMLNLLRYLFEVEPDVVAVDFSRPERRNVTLRLDAVPALFEIAELDSVDWHEGVTVCFEHGHLAIDLPAPLDPRGVAALTLAEGRYERGLRPPESDLAWSFERQARSFVRDVADRREPLASGADAVNDLILAEEIWRRYLEIAA